MSPRTALVVLAVGCLGCNPQPGKQPDAALTVMSFNIRYGTARDGENRWDLRRDIVFNVVEQHDPDVLGVQEALAFQVNELHQALPDYDWVGVGRDDGAREGEFTAIFYRRDRFRVDTSGTFWLSETPETVASVGWGNTITRICTWARFVETATRNPFYVYNVHLDHQSQPSRERSVELVARRILARQYDDPVVLTGDFNAGEQNPAMRYLRGEISRASAGTAPVPSINLVDTYRELHPDASESGTFGAWSGETAGDRIDAILVLGFDVADAEIVHDNLEGRYPSDHFPVTAIVRWTANLR